MTSDRRRDRSHAPPSRGASRLRSVALIAALALLPAAHLIRGARADEPAAAVEPIRVGIIGVDTSHALAFTKIFASGAADGTDDGAPVESSIARRVRVVAFYPHGSRDIPSSVTRIEKNAQALEELGLERAASIAELLEGVDAVLLETNDGRRHVEQAIPVLRAGKPVFVDKPIAASLTDVLALGELARATGTPIFSSSALRWARGAQLARAGEVGRVVGVDAHSPAPTEPTHPDLYWYGIHGAEPLFTALGPECERVRRVHARGTDLVIGEWTGGRLGTLRGIRDGRRGYGGTVFGEAAIIPLGGYGGYEPLVEAIAGFFRGDALPVPFEETLAIYAFLSAAEESRRRGGEPVDIAELIERSRPAISDGVVLDSAFPAGNVVVEAFDGHRAELRPDLRDTERWWFWWAFRVRGAAGRTVEFRFAGPSPIGPRGPAVSRDGGRSWSWLGADSVEGASFRYRFGAEEATTRFAFAIPYHDGDLRRFLARHEDEGHLRVESLGESRRHRDLQALRVGRVDGEAPVRVLLTARHHACEAMASYVLEGIIEEALAESAAGRRLRERVEIFAVPFVDVDGVEEGDQGKLRAPHDHNRDYGGESIWPETRAIRARVRDWAEGRLRAALDLHCPWIRGGRGRGGNQTSFFVHVPGEERRAALERFSRLVEDETADGPLEHRAANDLPWGEAWNTAEQGLEHSSAHWMSGLEGVRLAATLEFPYADHAGESVTPDAARAFGRALARALTRWLEDGGRR